MAQTSPTILLFARGTLALLDLWPALTIAVSEQWGGPDSLAKKTWLASTIIDEFESRATYLPAEPTSTIPNAAASTSTPGQSAVVSGSAPIVDPSTANDPPVDRDDLADLLHQMMSDEFDANIEDGSIDSIASDLVRLWRDVLGPEALLLVQNLENKADEVKKSGVKASSAPEEEFSGDEDDEDEDEDMEVDGTGNGGAPQLVDSRRERERERQEPVVDEDGFELVQKGKRR